MSDNEKIIIDLIKSGMKISAIKHLRKVDNIGLAEAKRKVESLQQSLIDAGEIDASTAKSGCLALLIGVSLFTGLACI